MNEADIVLTSIITSDGSFKKRPALILKILPKYNDLLLCGISTQIHQKIVDFDLLIEQGTKDFSTSGLVKESIVRLGYISVIPTQYIEGKLGFINKDTHKLLIKRLCSYLIS